MKAEICVGGHCNSVAGRRVVETDRKRCGGAKICFGGRATRLADASDMGDERRRKLGCILKTSPLFPPCASVTEKREDLEE